MLAQAVTAVEILVAAAETAAAAEDATVTSKVVMPPTGTKRTYYSLDTYAWPTNGNISDFETPWVARDGYMNAEVRNMSCAHAAFQPASPEAPPVLFTASPPAVYGALSVHCRPCRG